MAMVKYRASDIAFSCTQVIPLAVDGIPSNRGAGVRRSRGADPAASISNCRRESVMSLYVQALLLLRLSLPVQPLHNHAFAIPVILALQPIVSGCQRDMRFRK